MVKFSNKVFEDLEKREEKKEEEKNVFKFIISEKNVSTYAVAPKIT